MSIKTQGIFMKLSTLLLSLSLSAATLFAGEAKIIAAADLVYCFGEMEKVFEKQYPSEKLTFTYGSSGKAMTQISKGAPYDMFFSADMGYIQKLKDSGFIISNPKPYAYGRVGLFAIKGKGIDVSKGLSILSDSKVSKIAIADPSHAPYGVAAVNVLKSQKKYELVKDKLVLGENVSQAAQFVTSGAAEVGIIPISLGYSDKLKAIGNFNLLPGSWHNNIIQGYGITTMGKNNETAKKFEAFVATPQARTIFKKYGFVLPNE
jgi:molybdate transport system substrate-binding protein